MIKTISFLSLAGLLAGCSSMRIEDFSKTEPVFVPETYFDGPMTAYGIIKNRRGDIVSSFKGDLVGSWDENGIGTLDEKFVYADGDTQTRIWTFTPDGTNRYIGTAGDIVGEAPMVVNGNTMMIDYTMRIPYKGKTIDIDVKDWLHLQADGVIINHSKMRKFGFRVGELVITIIKDFPPDRDVPSEKNDSTEQANRDIINQHVSELAQSLVAQPVMTPRAGFSGYLAHFQVIRTTTKDSEFGVIVDGEGHTAADAPPELADFVRLKGAHPYGGTYAFSGSYSNMASKDRTDGSVRLVLEIPGSKGDGRMAVAYTDGSVQTIDAPQEPLDDKTIQDILSR
jgi:hypothetical protein